MLRRNVLGVIGIGLALILGPPRAARAQNAANTATARDLAHEGIALYREGKFEPALDRLKRAQSLYDAPVHVLYIARCQAKLGKYLEAVENYRKLRRLKLSENAPRVFKTAVADAGKEISEAEAKIARLRIEIQPANVPELTVHVGDVQVPLAALGVDRPTNPGQLKITVSAQGYENFEQTIELAPAGRKTVKVELTPAATPSAPTPAPIPAAAKSAPEADQPPPAKPTKERDHTALFIAGGATAVLATGAVVTAILAHGKRSDFENANSDPAPNSHAERQDLHDSAKTMQWVNTGLTAAAVAAGGLTLYFALGSSSSQQSARSRPRLVPWAAPSGGGAMGGGAMAVGVLP